MAKALICIDASNIHFFCRKAGWEIDWQKFRNYFSPRCETTFFYYYEGVRSLTHFRIQKASASEQDHKEAKKKKLAFFRYLTAIGFTVRHKTTSTFYSNTTGKYMHKCNFDVEITIDALDLIGSYDELILVSGDGDFEKLVKYLKGKQKFVTIVTGKFGGSKKLLQATNRQIYLDDLRGALEKK